MRSLDWESKRALLAVRAVSMVFGLLRTLVTIRLLAVQDYALIGIAEGVRQMIATFTSLGVAESLIREGAAAEDSGEVPLQLSAAYGWGLALTGVSALATLVVVLFTDRFGSDYGLQGLLILTIAVSFFERNANYATSSARALHQVKPYVLVQILQSVWTLVLSAWLTWQFGVTGYFVATCLGLALAWAAMHVVVTRKVGFPRLRVAGAAFMNSSRTLWGMSWYVYWQKNAQNACDQLPFLVGSTVLPREVVGVVAIGLDLARRLNTINQAVLVTTVARMTQVFTRERTSFPTRAWRELREITAINCGAAIAAFAGFLILGPALLGARFEPVLWPFLILLVAQLASAVGRMTMNVVFMPARNLDPGLTWAVAGIAAVGATTTWGLAQAAIAPVLVVPLAMLLTSVLLFAAMMTGAVRVIRSEERPRA